MLVGAQAGVLSAPGAYLQAAPLAVAKVVVDPNYDPNPQYSYSYSVQDALTGDSKVCFSSIGLDDLRQVLL